MPTIASPRACHDLVKSSSCGVAMLLHLHFRIAANSSFPASTTCVLDCCSISRLGNWSKSIVLGLHERDRHFSIAAAQCGVVRRVQALRPLSMRERWLLRATGLDRSTALRQPEDRGIRPEHKLLEATRTSERRLLSATIATASARTQRQPTMAERAFRCGESTASVVRAIASRVRIYVRNACESNANFSQSGEV